MWTDEAACRNGDVNVFFPHNEHLGPGGVSYRAAKAICAGCIVRDECLDEAMREEGGRSSTARHGCRGGLTPEGRARLHRTRRRATLRLVS